MTEYYTDMCTLTTDTHIQSTTRTKPAVHVSKTVILVMQLTVFQQSPELHTCHDKSIVMIDFMTQSTVECIYTVKACHVTQHYK